MATHSSKLAWEITRTEEPGRLQSMGQQRVRHDLVMKQQQAGSGSYGIFGVFLAYSFIYLAAPGLNCGTWALQSSSHHEGSSALACGIQFPDQGSNLGQLHWKCSLNQWTTREVPVTWNLGGHCKEFEWSL